MEGQELKVVDTGEFSARAMASGNVVYVRFQGALRMEHPSEVLGPLIEQIHKSVNAAGAQVKLDCRNLSFLNSAGIKMFVEWIKRIRGLAAPQRYQLQFIVRRDVQWQVTSMHAIRCFGGDIVTVSFQNDGEPATT